MSRNYWSCTAAVLALAMVPATASVAEANSFPERPITMMVGFSAGGPTDVMARRIALELEPILGQPIAIVNRPGAATTIAMAELAVAAPDGYTLYFGGSGSHGTTPHTMPDLPYDISTDFTAIAVAGAEHLAFAVHPSVPAETLTEFVELVRDNPGDLSFGHSGLGSIGHLTGELLLREAGGLDLLPIAYQGAAPAVIDALGGHIEAVVSGLGSVYPHHRDDALRILAIAGEDRTVLAPEIPTAREMGFDGVISTSTFIMLAPAGVPEDVVATLSDAVNAVMANEAFQEELIGMFVAPTAPSTPESTEAFLAAELAKWGDLVAAGVNLE